MLKPNPATEPRQLIHLPALTRFVTIGEYVRCVKAVKASPAGTIYKQSFCGWWPARREEILAQFGRLVTDKINRDLQIRELSNKRLHLIMRKRIKSDCRWCGQNLDRYEPHHRQFCDESCRHSYYF